MWGRGPNIPGNLGLKIIYKETKGKKAE